MDAKQMAGKCGQMMAGLREQGGEASGMREQCTQMAAMFADQGETAAMLKCCEQMAAQFAGHAGTAEEPEQSDREDPQFA